MREAYERVSHLQSAQQSALEATPLQEAAEFQEKLDTLRAELSAEKGLWHRKWHEREAALRQEFEQELADVRRVHREELEDLRQQQAADGAQRSEAALQERQQQVNVYREQVAKLRAEVSSLNVRQSGAAGAARAGGDGSWERDMIANARRDSDRRYGDLGLMPDASPQQQEAMGVYLKNLVVNLLCENDAAVKATLVPSLADLLHFSAAETEFVYRCHPEWRPNAPSSTKVWRALFGT